MAVQLDHIVIAVDDLDRAIADYRVLGFTVRKGGYHSAGTTENALITFADGTYLELIGLTGEPDTGTGTDFAALLGERRGLAGMAFTVDALRDHAAALVDAGMAVQPVKSGQRVTPSGETARWEMAFLNDSMAPFFIEDQTARTVRVPNDARRTTHENGVLRVEEIQLFTHQLDDAEKYFSQVLSVEGIRTEDGIMFPLENTTVRVALPTDDTHREHLESHGMAPYSITLVTHKGAKPSGSTHGARLQFIPPPEV